jgi:sugar O-acyltransferase (sialic acid O-acetyltransferase NeuD family)
MIELIFLGASTAFYEVDEIVFAINKLNPTYKFIGILDDNPAVQGTRLREIPVVGTLGDAKKFPHAKFVFGIGSIKTRLVRDEILAKTGLTTSSFESIVHPSAVIDRTAKIGNGCIFHPGVCVGNDAIIEPFTIIAVNSAIAPYVKVGEFSMITSLALVLTAAELGRMCFIGSHSIITENVKVGEKSMVGVGTIVSRNIDKGVFVLGNPMRIISKTSTNE